MAANTTGSWNIKAVGVRPGPRRAGTRLDTQNKSLRIKSSSFSLFPVFDIVTRWYPSLISLGHETEQGGVFALKLHWLGFTFDYTNTSHSILKDDVLLPTSAVG